jgi:hypothetical protein
VSSITKVQTSITLHGVNETNPKNCWFSLAHKAFSDDPRTRTSWSVDRSLAELWFRKDVRVETRITKIDETLATSRKLKNIFS